MKISEFSIIAILLVVLAVAISGCSSTSPTAPATGGTPAPGSVVSGANLFGAPPSYTWIEYKMSQGGNTVYTKIEKSGKCTVRMEGAGLPSGSMTLECGSAAKDLGDPSKVYTDPTTKYTFVGIEPVSVPAGTYPAASKYTQTHLGSSATLWTAPGVPGFVKIVSGDATMELNGWG